MALENMECYERIYCKNKVGNQILSKRIATEKEEILNQKTIVQKVNGFFVNIGPNWAKINPNLKASFKSYMNTMEQTFIDLNLQTKN